MNLRVWKKKCILLAMGILLAVGMAGCTKKESSLPETAKEEGETPLVLEFYGTLDEGYIPFFNALQEQFPEVTFRYEFQWDIPGIYETERRILHGDGPDLAVVNGAALLSLTEKDLLLDLTNMPFSTRYHVSMMSTLNRHGRVLGLPLPNDLRCLVANRTILEKNGIQELPQTVPELVEICKVLLEHDQRAIIMDEQIYQMLLRTSYLCKPEGYDWLQAYNEGEGAMAATPAEEAWERYAALAEVSGCNEKDASSPPARRTTLMLEGKYAFRSVTVANLEFMRQSSPELDLVALPLLGETAEDQWAFYAEQKNMRYFVANGALGLPENAKKQELAMQILDWISTEKTQQLLASCSSAAISYVQNVNLEQGNTMEYIIPVIERGHLTGSDTFGRGVDQTVIDCASKMVGGSMTVSEAVAACDRQNKLYSPPEQQKGLDQVVGTATDTIYWRKPAAVTVGSPMAQLAAYAMAEAFPEADFAFCMAKNAASTLYQGDITRGDISACADGEQNSELFLVQATGKQIQTLIDAGVGSTTEATFLAPYGIAGKGRLLHPAGLTYQADVSRQTGDKLTKIALTNGDDLNQDKTYTIAVSRLLIDGVTEPNLKDCPAVPAGKYLGDVLTEYIENHGEVSSPQMQFEIKGAAPMYTFPE